jgi:hypothetical protein
MLLGCRSLSKGVIVVSWSIAVSKLTQVGPGYQRDLLLYDFLVWVFTYQSQT